MGNWYGESPDDVIQMFVEGKTQSAIAEMYGVARISVSRILRKNLSAEAYKKLVAQHHKDGTATLNNYPHYTELRRRCVHLFETTDMLIQEIADEVGVCYPVVRDAIEKCGKYSQEEIRNIIVSRAGKRTTLRYDELRCGRGDVPKKYITTTITKSQGNGVQKSILKHTKILLDSLGLKCLPQGMVVHHVNGDKWDNRIANLVLMTRSEHTILHKEYLKGVTTISKESTLKWVEARRQGADKNTLHDIVCSGQECPAASNVASTD